MQEEQNKKWEAVEQQRKVQEAREQEARTVQNINKYVQEKHGLSPEETQEFVTQFSDPSSINMDNLEIQMSQICMNYPLYNPVLEDNTGQNEPELDPNRFCYNHDLDNSFINEQNVIKAIETFGDNKSRGRALVLPIFLMKLIEIGINRL